MRSFVERGRAPPRAPISRHTTTLSPALAAPPALATTSYVRPPADLDLDTHRAHTPPAARSPDASGPTSHTSRSHADHAEHRTHSAAHPPSPADASTPQSAHTAHTAAPHHRGTHHTRRALARSLSRTFTRALSEGGDMSRRNTPTKGKVGHAHRAAVLPVHQV